MQQGRDHDRGSRSVQAHLSRRRFLEVTLVGTLGTALLSACQAGTPAAPTSQPAGAAQPGTAVPATSAPAQAAGRSSVIPFYTTEDDPNTVSVAKATIDAFQSQHPGVEVNLIVVDAAQRDQRALTGLQVGQDLGVFEIDATYRAQLVESDYLYPLDSVVKEIGPDEFSPGTRLVVNGHDYSFPYAAGPFSLWYRKDKIPTAPKTYDDLKAAAAQQTGNGSYGVAFALGAYSAVTDCFPAFVWSRGGDYFDPSGNVLFGSDHVTQAIQDYADMLKYAPPGNTNWAAYNIIDAYLSGSTMMAPYAGRLGFNIPSKAPQLEDATSVVPGPWGPLDVGFVRWSHLVVDKKTANPEMAMQFMKFLLTGENGAKYANSVPGQLIPSVKSARDASLQATDNPYVQKHRDWLTTLAGHIEHSVDLGGPMGANASGTLKLYNGPPAPWAGDVWGVHSIDMQMVQKIALENMSPKDGQAWATDQYQSAVADYKSKHPDWRPYNG